MSLYSHISAFYDKLFPVDPDTIRFVESIVPGDAERRLLDLGAATGGHVEAFARHDWDTLGIELDGAMAEAAALKAHVVRGSMLDADRLVVEDYGLKVPFGAALCLGNTLPHIPPERIGHFFHMVKRLLHPGAPFVLQTLNYAHPSIIPGYAFPRLEGADYTFDREYRQGENPGTFSFVTTFRNGGREFKDVTVLYRHMPEYISDALEAAGFKHVERMAGWDGRAFDARRDRYLVTVGR